jgi:hypothetical protein
MHAMIPLCKSIETFIQLLDLIKYMYRGIEEMDDIK